MYLYGLIPFYLLIVFVIQVLGCAFEVIPASDMGQQGIGCSL